MYLLKRQNANGKFNIKPAKKGGYVRLMRNKTHGYGAGEEMYDNADSKRNKTPIEHMTQQMNHLKVRKSKPRKYISLNL
jgi:hypothetical protein